MAQHQPRMRPPMIISAHELTKTTFCAAERCEMDAEPNQRLCFRCERKDTVKLHAKPEVYTGPTLPCCTCKQFKPDEAFSKQTAHKSAHRRQRNNECKACCTQRRRDKRTQPGVTERETAISRACRERNGPMTPEQRAHKNHLARLRYAKAHQ